LIDLQTCFSGIGQANGKSVYRAAEIVDVVETTKVYSVGSVRTNTGLKLKFGKQERVFRLEFISNQHILIQEFAKWKEACVESSMSVPTLDFVKVKGSEIKKALSYEYTSDDVDKIVAQKGRFLRHPVNYAMHKARLMKEKEIAIANGDDALARELETKLNDHEERAEELDKQRTSTISSVSLINDRNRKANVSKAESAIRHEMKVKLTEGVQSNPFTRRKCNPRIVTKKVDKTGLDIRMEKEKENLIKIAETTITLKRNAGEAVEGGGEVAKDGAEPAKKAKKTKLGMGMPMAMQKEDLFDAHNFDIEIDVGDTSLTSPGAPGGPTGPSSAIALKAVSLTTTSTTKKSFNLGDYKKKMGLM
jgi:RNA polymerase-associated protein RTF1